MNTPEIGMVNPELLELFCQAVSDVGSLSWWAAGSGEIQVEFTGTQLLGKPLEPQGTPCGTVAVRFAGDVQSCFLRRAGSSLDGSWPELLQSDRLRPLRLRMDNHFLWHGGTPERLQEWRQAVSLHGAPGSALRPEGVADLPWRMLVWAGDVGIAVAAREAELVSHAGRLQWTDVPDLYRRWWSYWESYWQVRESAEALPWDYACEATVPLEA